MNILEEICEYKRGVIAESKRRVSLAQLQEQIAAADRPRDFAGALLAKAAKGQVGLIAEIKKASPSRGLIREDFDAAALAQAYESGGASCLSVLTDEKYFQGSADYLRQARAAVSLPVIRKDFMLDAHQVYEARAMGADAILLIMAALSDAQARELEECAFTLGLSVLIEVHDAEEMERALRLQSPLMGVNNRNLKTLAVDLDTSRRLHDMVPEGRICVCESGIKTHADIRDMQSHGIHCFLVGESLMLQPNVAEATAQLLGRP